MNAALERPRWRDSSAWRRVAERLGLASELLATPGLDRWIEDRATVLEIDSATYVDRLMQDESERRRFASQIAVPESWLGRYPASMDVVRDLAARVAGGGGVLRVISLGCAAGQELFSVLLSAREAGLPDRRMRLHGVDRNSDAIAQARAGLLPSLAVRADLPEAWRAYFTRMPEGWQVADDLQAAVSFHEADLLHDEMPIEAGGADLVLCRNVLIYLDPDARRRLVQRAATLLAPGGLLLTGHADPPSDLREAFRPLDHAGAFAWRGVTAEDVMPAAPSPPRRRISRAAPMVPDTSDQPVTSQPASIDRTVLAEIRRLADAGELGVARLRAESLAAERTPDAALESLLGEIASAEGRLDEARGHWRRALYLDADHADALVHLTLLSESQGDSDAAAGYRRRLERLETDTEFES